MTMPHSSGMPRRAFSSPAKALNWMMRQTAREHAQHMVVNAVRSFGM